MNRFWSGLDASRLHAIHPVRAFLLGQFLAVVASVSALAAHLAFGPLLTHSVYLFCAPAVLIAAGLGGAASGVTATFVLTAGAFAADMAAGMAAPERALRAAGFLLLGL